MLENGVGLKSLGVGEMTDHARWISVEAKIAHCPSYSGVGTDQAGLDLVLDRRFRESLHTLPRVLVTSSGRSSDETPDRREERKKA